MTFLWSKVGSSFSGNVFQQCLMNRIRTFIHTYCWMISSSGKLMLKETAQRVTVMFNSNF